MHKKVVVTVDEKGTTTTDYSNFEGAACLTASRQFHVLLAQFGVCVEQTDMKPKPELLVALGEAQEHVEDGVMNHEQGREYDGERTFTGAS